MATIHIDWQTDWHNCEDCGLSTAEGAFVTVDGTEIELSPAAACFDGTSHPPGEVLARLLEHLGHVVTHETVTRQDADGDEHDQQFMRLDGEAVPELDPDGATADAVTRLLERLGHEVLQVHSETGRDDAGWDD